MNFYFLLLSKTSFLVVLYEKVFNLLINLLCFLVKCIGLGLADLNTLCFQTFSLGVPHLCKYSNVCMIYFQLIARSIPNLKKQFFYSRKNKAFTFRISMFLRSLKNKNEMKIAGQNRIFPPLSIIKEVNKIRNSINHLPVMRNNELD